MLRGVEGPQPDELGGYLLASFRPPFSRSARSVLGRRCRRRRCPRLLRLAARVALVLRRRRGYRIGREPVLPRLVGAAGAAAPSYGAPLWLGRTRRLASRQQRLLLAAINRGCVYPGCDTPALRCEVMHLHDRVKGGPTDIDTLALGCDYYYHHHHRRSTAGPSSAAEAECGAIPPWIDPQQTPPRVDTVFHNPDIFTPPD
jgi:hypothetical protein